MDINCLWNLAWRHTYNCEPVIPVYKLNLSNLLFEYRTVLGLSMWSWGEKKSNSNNLLGNSKRESRQFIPVQSRCVNVHFYWTNCVYTGAAGPRLFTIHQIDASTNNLPKAHTWWGNCQHSCMFQIVWHDAGIWDEWKSGVEPWRSACFYFFTEFTPLWLYSQGS